MKGQILNLYKKQGETPLERIKRFKADYPVYGEVKMSYAGRLDPMAEGVLLVLVGEENKKREEYLGQSKDYVFDILFGVGTDTYDPLGKIVQAYEKSYDWNALEKEVHASLDELTGKMIQKYPPYSSKPVKGPNGEPQKPLFEWAKLGKIEMLDLPETEVEIYDIKPVVSYSIPPDLLSRHIYETIVQVNGDFRQQAIFESWVKFFDTTKRESFNLMRIKISCSSGTYVRSIVNNLGKKIGVPALAFKIVRTKIGEFRLEDSV